MVGGLGRVKVEVGGGRGDGGVWEECSHTPHDGMGQVLVALRGVGRGVPGVVVRGEAPDKMCGVNPNDEGLRRNGGGLGEEDLGKGGGGVGGGGCCGAGGIVLGVQSEGEL